jgi:hypothetical protein
VTSFSHPAIMAAILFGFSASCEAGNECQDVPQFIGMYGKWESVAVKAEPAGILDEHPEWTVPHVITGRPTEVCPGITFVVEQVVGGETVRSQLTYVYDQATARSFGVISGSNGTRLRGDIRHGPGRDFLVLSDFNGNPVWEETKVWISENEFESEGLFDFHGEAGTVWFRTYRVRE